jgi:3-oxoacyl-[acyl-carrier-protein] synthase II
MHTGVGVHSACIRGWAWRTPLGNSVEGVMAKLRAGATAAVVNPRFDTSSYACKLAAVIPGEPARSKHQRFLRRMGLYAVEVAIDAMRHAERSGSERVGLFFGYGGLRAHWNDMMPALEAQHASGEDAWERGLKLLHPFWMLQHLSNNAHAIAAEELDARGEGVTFGGANAGAQALAAAHRALTCHAVDTAVVVAYDTLLEPETLVELDARKATTRANLAALIAPYEQGAAGFVPGEAAAALVLERAFADTNGCAFVQAADGADGAPGSPSVATLVRVARQLAQDGDLIDGAGLGDRAFDAAERDAFRTSSTGFTSTLAQMGQLGAANSIVQAIALAEHLRLGSFGTHQAALGLSAAAPGLAATIRVSRDQWVPPTLESC